MSPVDVLGLTGCEVLWRRAAVPGAGRALLACAPPVATR
ncbi:hypothetical protein SAMN05421507_117150 [Lentzea jiangxiensis]|uniref:Uncharacterized protein n=1 Tax=Lentzea jiangxiensis TaxID=641025 RepID=A0A1H0W7W7_9PSEU|nr:hypothetical protein SAMN05421507_117150 [Lentzea jiangxiensis]